MERKVARNLNVELIGSNIGSRVRGLNDHSLKREKKNSKNKIQILKLNFKNFKISTTQSNRTFPERAVEVKTSSWHVQHSKCDAANATITPFDSVLGTVDVAHTYDIATELNKGEIK